MDIKLTRIRTSYVIGDAQNISAIGAFNGCLERGTRYNHKKIERS